MQCALYAPSDCTNVRGYGHKDAGTMQQKSNNRVNVSMNPVETPRIYIKPPVSIHERV